MATNQQIEKLLKDTSTLVLDVRTLREFQESSLPGAVLIPVDQLEQRVDELPKEKDKNILVYCAHGVRSLTAVSILKKHGYTSVFNLDGGLAAYGVQSPRN